MLELVVLMEMKVLKQICRSWLDNSCQLTKNFQGSLIGNTWSWARLSSWTQEPIRLRAIVSCLQRGALS